MYNRCGKADPDHGPTCVRAGRPPGGMAPRQDCLARSPDGRALDNASEQQSRTSKNGRSRKAEDCPSKVWIDCLSAAGGGIVGGAEPPQCAPHQRRARGVQHAADPAPRRRPGRRRPASQCFALPLARLEPYGMMILIAALLVLPLLGTYAGVDLNVLPHLIGAPVEAVLRAIIRLTGNSS